MVEVVRCPLILYLLVVLLLLKIILLQDLVIHLLVGQQRVMEQMMAMDGLIGVVLGNMIMVNMVLIIIS